MSLAGSGKLRFAEIQPFRFLSFTTFTPALLTSTLRPLVSSYLLIPGQDIYYFNPVLLQERLYFVTSAISSRFLPFQNLTCDLITYKSDFTLTCFVLHHYLK